MHQDQLPDPWYQIKYCAGIAAIILCCIGALMQLQTVSLLSGDGIYWAGAAVAGVGAGLSLLAWRKWIRVVAAILVAVCVINVTYAETQLNDRRNQIQNIVSH